MSGAETRHATIRTTLELLIRERQQTFEEFAADAERFAREHGEPGTLSVRHLQRLVAGVGPEGKPLAVRPATARLLQRILGMSIEELLAPPRHASGARLLRVAIAVVLRDADVLIVCRRGEEADGITWQFPAGVVKPGMPSATVAVRETFAETGVHCVVSRKLGSRLHPVTKVLCDYVLCDYVTGSATNADVVENVDAMWATRDELTRLIPVEQIYEPVLDALDAAARRRVPAGVSS